MLVARVALVAFAGSLLVARPASAQGITTVESVNSAGNPGNDASGSDFINAGDRGIAISADGNVVAFSSRATNLVAGDTNAMPDVFVHDRATGITTRVNVDSAGTQSNQGAQYSTISADGSTVAFASIADDLVAGDTNGWFDIFLHDLNTGVTERVSVDSNGVEGDWNSTDPSSLSADGRIVAFTSFATNLVAGDTNGAVDVFVHDRSTGITERESVDSSGNQTTGRIFGGAQISGDGIVVVFESDATDLVPNDLNGYLDVFAHDRATGATELMSVSTAGVQATSPTGPGAISGDGRFVTFISSDAGFVPGDKNRDSDVFVHDRVGGFTDCVSVNAAGVPADWTSRLAALSDDGQTIVFASRSGDLVPGVHGWQVYARERCNAAANWTNYGAGFPGTFGVPTFTARSFPTIGSTVTVDLANSSGGFSAGVLYVAAARAQLHTSLGGDLLLVPDFGVVFGLPPVGFSLQGDLARDDALCGIVIDLQALELDPGAAKGVSFTPGLEIVIGH